MSDADPPILDAGTLILLRTAPGGGAPLLLMGRRGGRTRFMPHAYVFPGGSVDEEDRVLAAWPGAQDALAPEVAPETAFAALRETFEETGLRLGRAARREAAAALGALGDAVAPDWRAFLGAGVAPDLGALRLFFRAVTPPGRPKRFDARFFLADADALADDPDDLSRASGELSDLAWRSLAESRALDLPFITTVVLDHLQQRLSETGGVAPLLRESRASAAPFVKNDEIDALRRRQR